MKINEITLNKLDSLIDTLPEISKKERRRSFFEIGGIAHKENIISNYLAYYFDQNEYHHLDNLFLRSLLEVIGHKDKDSYSELVEVKREVKTEDNKRIDILIILDDKVVIIENKIYHKLVNPLSSYTKYVKDKYPHREIIKIV